MAVVTKGRILYLVVKYGKVYTQYKKDKNKALDKEEERKVVYTMFDNIFRELTNTKGLYIRRSKEEKELYICDYGDEDDYELLVMDLGSKQLRLVTKTKKGIRVSRLGLGVFNTQKVNRLPNHTSKIVDSLILVQDKERQATKLLE